MYNFTDCKPIGPMTTKEIQALERKYQLILKDTGFQDAEPWTTPSDRPKVRFVKMKFIRGHNRSEGIRNRAEIGTEKNKFDFYRMLGLYAHHSKDVPAKYVKVLIDYSSTGNLAQSIRNTKSTEKADTVRDYIDRNKSKMITFVNEEFRDDE